MKRYALLTLGLGAAAVALIHPALAQEAADAAAEAVDAAPAVDAAVDAAAAGVPLETQFIFNTLSFFIHGALVMWMAAGFAMLESGLVRSKNTATICLKNIALYAVAGIMYYIIGYDLMYQGVDGGYIGTFSLFWSGDDTSFLEGAFESGSYAATSDWYFQMVFVATAASIVSGTVAERTKAWSFMLFTVILTSFIYPITGSWQWGGGWLNVMGFSDFAGSTLVHSVGGWAALAGAIVVGARKGKFNADGSINPMPGSNLPLATLGTFILWLGWFGFNGGSQLALGSAADAIAIANIYANTNMAAAGGVVAAMIVCQLFYGKVDLTMALNGAIAGLVSITAAPDSPTIGQAILIGGVGGILVVFAVPLIDKLKIDDVVGAISAHLVCGIWGTLAVALTYQTEYETEAGETVARTMGEQFAVQATGVVSIGIFTLVTSFIVWFVIKAIFGVRPAEEDEELGLDKVELGLEAYPEFGQGSQRV
ncbi:MAG: ammonium transporter [Rhodospirillaceae bacterium]|nr:ammonium transporter [Rhodospirillaceae bacterium]MCA8934033.1 ammonium transporter [Rhodospirillaceae bacterium]